MNISVVVCAYNEKRWDTLVEGIISIQGQHFAPYEIIVVIDNNATLAQRVRAQFQEIVVLENHGPRGLSHARNLGIAHATGEVVAFIDDDATSDKDWLYHLAQHYNNQQVVGVGGYVGSAWSGQRPVWFPEEFDWVVGCSYRGLPDTTSRVRNFIGCNMSFRREALLEVNGFDPNLGRVNAHPVGCEETELCIRIQQARPDALLLYEPAAAVRHMVSANRGNWRYCLSRCFFEGRSKAQVTRLVGSGEGLSSERNYTLQTLPSGMLYGLQATILNRNLHGLARTISIVAGLLSTTSGYITGSVTL